LIAAIVVSLLSVLVAAGAYFLYQEWRRYKLDKEPAPPPTPEEASLDRWNAGVVIVVAGLSVVGALLAWWASSEFSAASSTSLQAVQEAAQYLTVKAEQDSYVSFGERLAATYQEHTVAESELYSEAARARRSGDTYDALQLEAQARVEGAQERAIAPDFLCYWPSGVDSKGAVSYNAQQLAGTEQDSPCVQPDQDPASLRTLDQSHVSALEAVAKSDRSNAEEIVLAGAFVIVAVFFMTISYLGWRHRRVRSLAPGVVAMAIALAVSLAAGLG
jgi:hypothetical protein